MYPRRGVSNNYVLHLCRHHIYDDAWMIRTRTNLNHIKSRVNMDSVAEKSSPTHQHATAGRLHTPPSSLRGQRPPLLEQRLRVQHNRQ